MTTFLRSLWLSQLCIFSLAAYGPCPISISTIAESSAGCDDGAIVVKTRPSGKRVDVTVNPGDYTFWEVTPAILRPEGTYGFAAGTYYVKVCTKTHKLKKTVRIPVAQYSVTVPPVQDAQCGCNGSFSTIFNNPDHADVDVTFIATQAAPMYGTIIGTSGTYTDLCPGTYHWMVQARSKSATCNHQIVFQDSGTVVIGGTVPVQTPKLTPATQTVPLNKPIIFSTIPVVSNATYSLFQVVNGSPVLRASQNNGNFQISSARVSDAGSYFVTLQVENCPTMQSNPVTVVVTTSSCPLSLALTPTNACNPSTTGSISLNYTGSATGTVDLFVNNVSFGTISTSPYVINSLSAVPSPQSYTVAISDPAVTNCSVQATTQLSVNAPTQPTLAASSTTCSGQPFSITVLPEGQATYTLNLPDGTQRVQEGNNVFQFFNASALVNDGVYTGTYVDSNGCTSAASAQLTVTIFPTPVAQLTPAVESVPQGSTIFFSVSPVLAGATYSLFVPNKRRGTPPGVITQSSPDFFLQSAGPDDEGSYFAQVKTAEGCTSDPSAASSVAISGTCDLVLGLTPIPACRQNGTGSILLEFTGGSGKVCVTVNGRSLGEVSSSELPFTIQNLAPNTAYTVKITDVCKKGCCNQATVDIGVVSPVTPTLIASSTCEGNPLTMTVLPATGTSYTLSYNGTPIISQASNVFVVTNSATPANNGTYTASFVDQYGCTHGPSNTVNVTVTSVPLVTLSPVSQTVPPGGAAFFTVTTNVSGPGVLFILTDPNGNTHTQSNGNFVISPAIAGTYTAQVLSTACPSPVSDPAVVSVGGCLPFTATPTPACVNKTTGSIIIDVADHLAPFTYSVQPGSITGIGTTSPFTIPNLQGGFSYTVTVTDATGTCSGTAGPIFIPLLPTPPQATLGPTTQLFVPGGTLTFMAGPTNVGPNCVFIFTVPNKARGNNGVITQTSPELVLTDATTADIGTYSVILNCGGCPSDPSRPVSVIQQCNLSIVSVTPTSSCGTPSVGTGALQITVSGGTPPYFYSADGIHFTQPIDSTTAVITGLPAGTYSNVTVMDSTPAPVGPCSAVSTLPTVIPAITPPSVSIQGSSFAALGSTIMLAATSSAANASFSWVGPANFSASTAAIAIPNATAANSGLYTVTAAAAAAAGGGSQQTVCINQASIYVTVGLAPTLTLVNASSKKICSGTCTSFVLTVQNTGAAPATNLVLTDSFPGFISVVNATGTGWTIRTNSSGLRATLPELGVGQSASITVNVKSLGSTPGQQYQSVATVTSDTTPAITATATITTACCPKRCR